MRESRKYGSVRGVASNGRSYRDKNTGVMRSSKSDNLCSLYTSKGLR